MPYTAVVIACLQSCSAVIACEQPISAPPYTAFKLVCFLPPAGIVLTCHQRWTGSCFEKDSLRSVGTHIQLGHPSGTKCLNPRPIGKEGFVIFDLNMIHIVDLSFCSCGESGLSHPIQLLRSKLYPATVVSPRTAMTFRLLEAFELLSYESKISAWEYFKALARLTDNTKLETQKVGRTRKELAYIDNTYLGALSHIPP